MSLRVPEPAPDGVSRKGESTVVMGAKARRALLVAVAAALVASCGGQATQQGPSPAPTAIVPSTTAAAASPSASDPSPAGTASRSPGTSAPASPTSGSGATAPASPTARREVIFRDDFSDKTTGWPQDSYVGGALEVSHQGAGGQTIKRPLQVPERAILIEVRADTDEGGALPGVICESTAGDSYVFFVNPATAEYGIAEFDARGRVKAMVSRGRLLPDLVEEGDQYSLTAACALGEGVIGLSFGVGNDLVAQERVEKTWKGIKRFGLYMSPATEGPGTTRFDDLVVSKLSRD